MTPEIPLGDAIATMPDMIRYWIMWMNIAILWAIVVFLFHKVTRTAGLILLVANLAMVLSMTWLYSQVGFVRLLGLPHLIFWTPLVAYFVMRLRMGGLPRSAVTAMVILTATLSISLVIDAIDVARWVLGERSSMLPA